MRVAVIALAMACSGRQVDPVVLVDAYVPGGPCEGGQSSCNLLSQTGCNSGEKCTWVVTVQCGYIGCTGAGDVDAGGACQYTSTMFGAWDDCRRGLACFAGTCMSICDQQGGSPPCTTGSCTVEPGLFGPVGHEGAGLCVVTARR